MATASPNASEADIRLARAPRGGRRRTRSTRPRLRGQLRRTSGRGYAGDPQWGL